MSEKLLEKVGFLRVIGKRSAMLTKLALRKPGGSEVRSRIGLGLPRIKVRAEVIFSIFSFSSLFFQFNLNLGVVVA